MVLALRPERHAEGILANGRERQAAALIANLAALSLA
jgi:hypothetical protein